MSTAILERVIVGLLGGLILSSLLEKRREVCPKLQGLFERFHDAIKLEENDERRNLRGKRDTLLAALKERLAPHALAFESFNQGSYAMRTGVVPKDGNYDIDVGLIFDCSQKRFPDPVELKSLIHDALAGGNRNVAIRRACVTVTYMKKGEPEYHVDLAIYLRRPDSQLLLAKGRKSSGTEFCEWVPSAPKELTRHVLSKFAGNDQAQYRRCIRYLKRWRDESFSSGAPLSIALTLAAALWFEPKKATDGSYIDVEALYCLVKKMGSSFGNRWDPNRLAVPLPGLLKADLMKKLTAPQMLEFKTRLKSLELALLDCLETNILEESVANLVRHFGSDFPRD
jgi:hypothetical protein